MAYGQTGSGKTHTMLGKVKEDGLPDMTGVIPSCVSELFRIIDERVDVKHTVTVSVVEIYNNTIRDLLGDKAADDKHEVGAGIVWINRT